MNNRQSPPETYESGRMIAYRMAASVIDDMTDKGVISEENRRLMLDALLDRYGIDKDSIYAI